VWRGKEEGWGRVEGAVGGGGKEGGGGGCEGEGGDNRDWGGERKGRSRGGRATRKDTMKGKGWRGRGGIGGAIA